MNRTIVFCFFILMQTSCTERNELSLSAGALIIRTGTSFGMCIGYCQHDYTVDSVGIMLVQTAPRTSAQNPAKTCQTTLTRASWEALTTTISFDAFSRQPERIGCPDCADGGTEYVELQAGDRTHRVSFEYGKTIPGFESLVTALRIHREQFSKCE